MCQHFSRSKCISKGTTSSFLVSKIIQNRKLLCRKIVSHTVLPFTRRLRRRRTDSCHPQSFGDTQTYLLERKTTKHHMVVNINLSICLFDTNKSEPLKSSVKNFYLLQSVTILNSSIRFYTNFFEYKRRHWSYRRVINL